MACEGKMTYGEVAAINVNDHVEKKNGLSYLSWAWAIDQLLREDPDASWEYAEPATFAGGTMMVFCTVTAFGRARTMQLPVMNHTNKAIPNPDAFAVNTAMQRCLVKAIALHGLGLYIYAGEDLPQGGADEPEPEPEADPRMENLMADLMIVAKEGGLEALGEAWKALPLEDRQVIGKAGLDALKAAAA